MAAPPQRAEALEDLRAHLKALAPTPSSPAQEYRGRLSTKLPALDELLEGGFARACITALKGASGAGLASLLRPAIFSALAAGERVGIVDGTQTLHAPDWFIEEGELWVIRTPLPQDALWSAETMAASGAFAITALLPPQSSRKISRAWAARLRQAARDGESALIVCNASSPAALNAAWGLHVTPHGLDTSTGRWTVHVDRIRGGPPLTKEISFDVQARLYARRLPASPLVPDRRAPPGRTP